MKKIVRFAIPAVVLTFAIVTSVYAWSVYPSTGYINSGSAPRTYADAYASNYGLRNGYISVYASAGGVTRSRQFAYGNGGTSITAQASKPNENVWAYALATVSGFDTTNSAWHDLDKSSSHPGA